MNVQRLSVCLATVVLAAAASAQAPPPTAPARPAAPGPAAPGQAAPSGPAAAPAPGGAKPMQQTAPPITVDPVVADFGVVEPGSTHPATFVLRNNSLAPLLITMALPSCKCTTLENYAGKTIPAGGTFEMKATLNAPATPGVKDAKVNVVIDGYTKPLILQLRCEVLLAIKAAEEFVDALKGVTHGVLTIESRDGKPFRILTSNGVAPSYVDFDPAKDAPRNTYKINWSVEGWPCEGMRLWWIVETDRPDCAILPCRIRHDCTGSKADPGRFERKWIFKEQVVNAGLVKPGETVRLKMEIENSEPKAGPQKPATMNQGFRQISGVRSDDPRATAKMIKMEPRGTDESLVTFEFTPAADASGMIYVPVRVTSPTGENTIAVVASVHG
ncbi:MAG: DUF1573 domain-containing protein [Phycisphaerales bacterium]